MKRKLHVLPTTPAKLQLQLFLQRTDVCHLTRLRHNQAARSSALWLVFESEACPDAAISECCQLRALRSNGLLSEILERRVDTVDMQVV